MEIVKEPGGELLKRKDGAVFALRQKDRRTKINMMYWMSLGHENLKEFFSFCGCKNKVWFRRYTKENRFLFLFDPFLEWKTIRTCNPWRPLFNFEPRYKDIFISKGENEVRVYYDCYMDGVFIKQVPVARIYYGLIELHDCLWDLNKNLRTVFWKAVKLAGYNAKSSKEKLKILSMSETLIEEKKVGNIYVPKERRED